MIAKSNKVGVNGGTMKALDVANYFIKLADQSSENDLTNLKLQKLLYYAQGKHLANKGYPLFEDKVEAWKYGPVVADVYHTFKECGQFPITSFDIDYTSAEIEDDAKSTVIEVWKSIGEKYSGYYLVQATHKPGTPWAEHYIDEARNIEIPQGDLKNYFSSNEL